MCQAACAGCTLHASHRPLSLTFVSVEGQQRLSGQSIIWPCPFIQTRKLGAVRPVLCLIMLGVIQQDRIGRTSHSGPSPERRSDRGPIPADSGAAAPVRERRGRQRHLREPAPARPAALHLSAALPPAGARPATQLRPRLMCDQCAALMCDQSLICNQSASMAVRKRRSAQNAGLLLGANDAVDRSREVWKVPTTRRMFWCGAMWAHC